MATLIHADGTIEDLRPAAGAHFELSELQSIVDGYIEVIRVGGFFWVLNEDGKRLGKPVNLRATELARGAIADDDWIVGNVIVCTLAELQDDEDAL